MVTLCVGEELTAVNAPLRCAGCTAMLFSFLSRVEVADRGGTGGEPGDGYRALSPLEAVKLS